MKSGFQEDSPLDNSAADNGGAAFPTDNDMIRVPRNVLASACFCVRMYAGRDSQTYQKLSALALTPAEKTYAGMPISEAMAGTYHPGDDA